MSDDVFETIGEFTSFVRIGGPDGRVATRERRFMHEVRGSHKIQILYSFAMHRLEVKADGATVLQVEGAKDITIVDEDAMYKNQEVDGD